MQYLMAGIDKKPFKQKYCNVCTGEFRISREVVCFLQRGSRRCERLDAMIFCLMRVARKARFKRYVHCTASEDSM